MSNPVPVLNFDSLLPPAMAEKAENAGIVKAKMAFLPMFALSVLAGAFIAMGAIFATTVTTGGSELTYGVSRVLGGLVFCLGLILVVVAGAELFTGNNLIVMAWASGKVSTSRLLRNWTIVYLGNFVGSATTALGMFWSGQYAFGGGLEQQTAGHLCMKICSANFPVCAVKQGCLTYIFQGGDEDVNHRQVV